MAVLKDTVRGKNGGRCDDGRSQLLTNSQKAAAFMFGSPFLKAFSLTHSLAFQFRSSSWYTQCLSCFPCFDSER